jgi:hypothetical protein
MVKLKNESYGCQPTRYQIKINGKFREDWSDWLSGLDISTPEDGEGSLVTILDGFVSDQAALRGILCKSCDLNLTILSVMRIENDSRIKEIE